jgi:hypothetical protein
MDLVDKIIKEWSWRCAKGYPQLDSEEDLRILEGLFNINLTEASLKANTLAAKQLLLQKYPDTFSDMKKYTRLGNTGKISASEFAEIIKKEFGQTPEVIAPGTPLNNQNTKPDGSREFSLFKFKTDKGDISIILAGGPKEENRERQEHGVINIINSIEGVKTIRDQNGHTIEGVLRAEKVASIPGYRYEPYSDIKLVIQGTDDPFLISAKGLTSPTIAGGGLQGIMLLSNKVQDFVKQFYEDAYQHYKKIFDENPELTPETNLHKTKYFKDVNRKVPEDIVLEIVKGTPAVGGEVDAYYIGAMDVKPIVEGNTITLNGNIKPVEEFAKNELFLHIKKRDGDYFFTDNTQTVNGVTMPRIFASRPNGTTASSRLGSLNSLRGAVII